MPARLSQPERDKLVLLVRQRYDALSVGEKAALSRQFQSMDASSSGTLSLEQVRAFHESLAAAQEEEGEGDEAEDDEEQAADSEEDEEQSGSGEWEELGEADVAELDNGTKAYDHYFKQTFDIADVEGAGKLDFFGCGLLLLLLEGGPCECDACHRLIIADDTLWACRTCCSDHLSLPPDSRDGTLWPTICLACRARDPGLSCTNCPDHRLEWVPNGFGRGAARGLDDWAWSRELMMHACDCCGELQRVGMASYLGGGVERHMSRDESGAFLCEWCTGWCCRGCGTRSVSLSQPQLGSWSIRTYECGEAKCRGGGGRWHVGAGQLAAEAGSEGRLQCSTCQPRLLRQTLYVAPTPEQSREREQREQQLAKLQEKAEAKERRRAREEERREMRAALLPQPQVRKAGQGAERGRVFSVTAAKSRGGESAPGTDAMHTALNEAGCIIA